MWKRTRLQLVRQTRRRMKVAAELGPTIDPRASTTHPLLLSYPARSSLLAKCVG
jgi:hypothetical protein